VTATFGEGGFQMNARCLLAVVVAIFSLPTGARADDPPAWKDARAVLEKASEWELLALDPFERTPDPKDAFHEWQVRCKTTVKSADARKALLAALDKGIADHAEKRRKELEMGLLKAGGCFQPRHGLRATAGGQTVEVLICFECAPVHFYLGERKGHVETVESPQDAFDRVLKDAGVSIAPRLLEPKK
jgi:hypothetical protein